MTCGAKIANLEPRLAQAEARLKQLGPPPGKDAPAEAPALAEERARLNKEFGELDAPLKQARLLAARADQLAEQITELRRAAYAEQLFEQTPSVLSPSLWLESARALPARIRPVQTEVLRAWWRAIAGTGQRRRVAGAVLTVMALAHRRAAALAMVCGGASVRCRGRRPASARR